MAELDAKLVAAIKLAKTAPMRFAFVSKGPGGKLLVSKKKVPAKEIAEAKTAVGGGMVFQGRCVTEEGTLVFEVAKEPPTTLAKQLKTVISSDAGLKMHVEVRVKADAELDSDEMPGAAAEGASASPPGTPGAAPPPVAAPAPQEQNPEAARFLKRMKAIMPAIEKIKSVETDAARNLLALVSAAGTFARDKDYPQANGSLDQVEPMLKQVLTSLLAGPAANGAGASPDLSGAMASWKEARETIVTRLRTLAGKVAAAKHAESTKAIIELNAVIKNLTPVPSTAEQVHSLARYLTEDDVVDDVCEFAFDIRESLLPPLEELSRVIA